MLGCGLALQSRLLGIVTLLDPQCYIYLVWLLSPTFANERTLGHVIKLLSHFPFQFWILLAQEILVRIMGDEVRHIKALTQSMAYNRTAKIIFFLIFPILNNF